MPADTAAIRARLAALDSGRRTRVQDVLMSREEWAVFEAAPADLAALLDALAAAEAERDEVVRWLDTERAGHNETLAENERLERLLDQWRDLAHDHGPSELALDAPDADLIAALGGLIGFQRRVEMLLRGKVDAAEARVAELEAELRAERAAVVAYLRGGIGALWPGAIGVAAAYIEAGLHRQGGRDGE